MKQTFSLTLALGLALGAAALAQGPPPPPFAHHGMPGGIFHRPGRPPLGRVTTAGQIIANKKTHVYHMPGDAGSLPSPANRVYFRTEAAAIAAGYHRAGAHRGPRQAPRHASPGSHTRVGRPGVPGGAPPPPR